MKKIYLFIAALLILSAGVFSQESILVIKSPYVMKLNAHTGDIDDAQFIDLSVASPNTPKALRQIFDEIWVTDQSDDEIYVFDLEGSYLKTISGGMDNIKGLGLVNNSEVWVTNAGTDNGAPGDAIVKFDLDGNLLGSFDTNDRSSFDVLDDGAGNVYISYISNGSPIEIRDYDGNFVEYFIPPNTLAFLEQMDITSSGNMLFTAFSSPSGVYLYDIDTGGELDYWAQSNPRGVIETGDGHILWSSGTGLYRIDPATGNSSTLDSGNFQFFALFNPDGSSDCTPPTLDITLPDSICEGESAVIMAATNGDIVNWYDSATATTPIFTGLEFTTPPLSTTTSYWVEAEFEGGEEITGGARVSPTSSDSSTVNPGTAPWGLTFTTNEAFTLNSVDVYLAGAAGNLQMQLLDANWQVLEETTVACPPGNSGNPVQFEVPLDFEVDAGKTYRLVAASSPDMIREFSSQHPGFPYPIGSAGSVTGGTINNSETNSTVYYFFYNWTVTVGSGEACVSDRMEAEVMVNPIPDTPGGEADQFFTQGQTLADLEVDATGDLTWYADEDGNTELPSNTELVDETTYYVSQTIGGCESGLFGITVHILLDVFDITGNEFTVYPNPVTDILNIVSKEEIRNVEIYDTSGRKLVEFNEVSNHQIDLSSLPHGNYILRFHTGKEIKTVKVIKK